MLVWRGLIGSVRWSAARRAGGRGREGSAAQAGVPGWRWCGGGRARMLCSDVGGPRARLVAAAPAPRPGGAVPWRRSRWSWWRWWRSWPRSAIPGWRRYLVAPAACGVRRGGSGSSCCWRRCRAALAPRRGASWSGLVALVPGLLRAREDARIARLAGRQAARAELRRAVSAAGGPAAVLRRRAPHHERLAADGAGLGAARAAGRRAGDLVVVAAPAALGPARARVPRAAAPGRPAPGDPGRGRGAQDRSSRALAGAARRA